MRLRRAPFSERLSHDAVLVRRMREGDESAFEEFFDANFQGLYRFVLARVDYDTDLAKDLTQAAIVTGIERLETYRGEAPLYSWLCTICRFEISRHFRRLRRRPPEVELPEEGFAARGVLESIRLDLEDPEDQLLRRELGRLVHVTTDSLPSHYRDVLRWKYLEGLPVREIAERLEISAKAAESLLTRARQAFRDGFSALVTAAAETAVRPEETR